ncbi:MAG: hypothetical protein RR482_06465, partial [Clostridia bacterium]
MFITGLLPLLMISAVSLSLLQGAIYETTRNGASLLIHQIVDGFDNLLNTYETESFQYGCQASVQKYLSDSRKDSPFYRDFYLSMVSLWSGREDLFDVAFGASDGTLKSIRVVDSAQTDGLSIRTTDYLSPALLERLTTDPQPFFWLSTTAFSVSQDSRYAQIFEHTVTLCRRITDINSGRMLGVMLWHMKGDSLAQHYAESIAPESSLVLCDEEGRVICSSGPFAAQESLDASLRAGLTQRNGDFSATVE